MFGFSAVKRAIARLAQAWNAWADDIEEARLAFRREAGLDGPAPARHVLDHFDHQDEQTEEATQETTEEESNGQAGNNGTGNGRRGRKRQTV